MSSFTLLVLVFDYFFVVIVSYGSSSLCSSFSFPCMWSIFEGSFAFFIWPKINNLRMFLAFCFDKIYRWFSWELLCGGFPWLRRDIKDNACESTIRTFLPYWNFPTWNLNSLMWDRLSPSSTWRVSLYPSWMFPQNSYYSICSILNLWYNKICQVSRSLSF